MKIPIAKLLLSAVSGSCLAQGRNSLRCLQATARSSTALINLQAAANGALTCGCCYVTAEASAPSGSRMEDGGP